MDPTPGKTGTSDERSRLVSLLEIGAGAQPAWSEGDLKALFQHQMNAVLEDELLNWFGGSPQGLRRAGSPHVDAPRTFGDLVEHPAPSVELLRAMKDYAKAIGSAEPATLPPEIGILLYYLALALAIVRLRHTISALPVDAVRDGVRWAANQPWVDDGRVRRCFSDCLEALEHGRGGPRA